MTDAGQRRDPCCLRQDATVGVAPLPRVVLLRQRAALVQPAGRAARRLRAAPRAPGVRRKRRRSRPAQPLVNDQWGGDRGCDASRLTAQQLTEAHFDRRLTVLKVNLTAALFSDAADYYCPGDPHPESFREQYLVEVKSGQVIDLWLRLPAERRARLWAQLVKLGNEAHRFDPCADAYRIEDHQRLKVLIESDLVAIEAFFPSVTRACTESLPVPKAEFRAWFAHDPEVVRMLDALD